MFETHNVFLLLVDDDIEYRSSVARRFVRRGFHIQEASSGEEAIDLAERRQFDVVILDMVMPGMSGLEVLDKLRASNPECEIIMLTGQATVESAVEAMKKGAYDYLKKPFPLAELEVLIEKAYERRKLAKENMQLKAVLGRGEPSSEIIGQSPAMREVFRLIDRAGPTDKAILIQGESGTGKELVARALQRHSRRADKPLVIINCAALSETLLESELFGHEKGAFTGAVAAKPGLFELADGGTLFIDEIGELAGNLQAKLLRALDDGSMRRVGSVKERHVNVRLLAATNRDMAEEVRAGRFREDLFYRINVMSLHLPPLREREGDVRLLIQKFLGRDWRMDDEALHALEAYRWPGNVRQLINAIERAKILADDKTIQLCDLPAETTRANSTAHATPTANGDRLEDLERAHVVDILSRERGNKARAARALGVNRRSLYRIIEKYHITGEELVGRD